MSIAKADILTFVNRVLERTETDIDIEIQTTLNDLSNSNLLPEQDTTHTLASGDTYLAYPTDFKDLVSIVLINANSVRQDPLIALPRGKQQYHELRNNDSATGIPEAFAEFDKKFWLWRPANAAYTVEIEYYRYHPQDVSDILFGDEFRNAIYFGAAYYTALTYGLSRYLSLWEPHYYGAKADRIDNMPIEPGVCEETVFNNAI